jgi:hypothetical protein
MIELNLGITAKSGAMQTINCPSKRDATHPTVM